jgi:hypothetical protein
LEVLIQQIEVDKRHGTASKHNTIEKPGYKCQCISQTV